MSGVDDEAVDGFRRAMADSGVPTRDRIVADGKLHRVHVEGDKPGSRNGWYVVFLDDVPAGAFGTWRTGASIKWCSKVESHLTATERAAWRQRIEDASRARNEEQQRVHFEVAERAAAMWEAAQQAPPDHGYLVTKQVRAFAIKSYRKSLLVPMRDAEGKLWSLQSIDPDGQKRSLIGGRKTGCFHIIGELRNDGVVILAEGYATAASIHEATGHPVVVAFDAGNLRSVAEALRATRPSARIILAADDDLWTKGNPGITKAMEAARAVSGVVVAPRFKDTSTKPSDFNDLAKLEGAEAVRGQLAAVMNGEKVDPSSAAADENALRSAILAGKVDPGALFEPTIIQALARLRKRDQPTFMRVRAQIKRECPDVLIAALDHTMNKVVGDAGEANAVGQGRPLDLPEPEPWPEPVNGAALLDELVGTVADFVVLPLGAADAVTLWIIHAHAFKASAITPRLGIVSPEMRCGKTTLLRVIGAIVPRPLPAANVTPAAMFRTIETARPTLLVDEADTFLLGNDELRGIINSGHLRDGNVIRLVGDDYEARCFSTWAPLVIACIGKLPPTIMDRSIVVPMRRKRADERVERLRWECLGAFKPLASKCARWAADNAPALTSAEPAMPEELHDRAADNWRPLLAIADLAGSKWPKRARDAALHLSAQGADDGSARALLLADIRGVFAETGLDRIASADLVQRLVAMEDRPWLEWRQGKPITIRQLAKLLSPFGLSPGTIRLDNDTTPKGYHRAAFADVFARYLPPDPQRRHNPHESAENEATPSATKGAVVADEKTPKPKETATCGGVADRNGGMAGVEVEWTG